MAIFIFLLLILTMELLMEIVFIKFFKKTIILFLNSI